MLLKRFPKAALGGDTLTVCRRHRPGMRLASDPAIKYRYFKRQDNDLGDPSRL
jgi:hypothetical protein